MNAEAQKENETTAAIPATETLDAPPSPAVALPPSADKAGARREISSIAFPYLPLEDAEEGAKAIYSEAGTASVSQPQAAAAMSMSQTSSAFRGRLAAMKIYGLMEYDQGRIQLTDLGRAIADPHAALDARVEAFLRVPLYEKYSSLHDGHQLPKPAALQAEFISFGVSTKQADRARQVFDRSAKHAGFIKPGTNRFVRPITGSRAPGPSAETAASSTSDPVQRNDFRGGGDGGGNDVDPVIRALVQKIPPPGSPWGVDEQVMWLRMMAMAFSMAYGGKRPITIQAEPEPTRA
jgi:hypothetical protein